MKYITIKDISYNMAWAGYTTIPKGTECKIAYNLSGNLYFVEEWPGMSEKVRSWGDTYGFIVRPDEVKATE